MSRECAICGIDHGAYAPQAYMGGTRLLLTTFPKCGTTLMLQYLNSNVSSPVHIRVSQDSWTTDDHISYDDGTICQLRDFAKSGFGHIPAKPRLVDAAFHRSSYVLFLIRDPRDQIASMYHWTNGKKNVMASMIEGEPDPVMAIINLVPDIWRRFLPWIQEDNVTTIRYEDLIEDQDNELERVAAVVAKTNSRWDIGGANSIKRRKNPARSPTFRKGGFGDWQSIFEEKHMEAFERQCSDVMEALGYDL